MDFTLNPLWPQIESMRLQAVHHALVVVETQHLVPSDPEHPRKTQLLALEWLDRARRYVQDKSIVHAAREEVRRGNLAYDEDTVRGRHIDVDAIMTAGAIPTTSSLTSSGINGSSAGPTSAAQGRDGDARNGNEDGQRAKQTDDHEEEYRESEGHPTSIRPSTQDGNGTHDRDADSNKAGDNGEDLYVSATQLQGLLTEQVLRANGEQGRRR